MATYYVDLSAAINGTGVSFGDPFNAFTSLPAMSGGDIVEIRSGFLPAAYTVTSSGSVGNPIVFRSDITRTQQSIFLSIEGGDGFITSSRSNLRFENLNVVGNISWTSQNTRAFVLGGAVTNQTFLNMTFRAARFEMSPGFAISGVTFTNCSFIDNQSDGFRSFSSIAAYTHSNITFTNCVISRNGKAGGPNGAGISFFVQDSHITCNYDNVVIINCTIEDNVRAGIAMNGTGVNYTTTISAPGNTTPPDQRFRGTVITNNRIRRNGGAGISLLGHKASTASNVLISYNTVEDCGFNTTIGAIWTGCCLNTIIEYNITRRSISNGTVVGDGQGIFDDQWNDGCIIRFNLIENNILQSFNPFYTAYGIGIYRSSNTRAYGNIIRGCRMGFYIGYVPGATAPVMSGITIENNTVVNTTNFAFTLNSVTPSNSLTIQNNFVLVAPQDVEAQSGAAGTQTWTNNIAIGVTTKYTGNNVPIGAFNHTYPSTNSLLTGQPTVGSVLLTTGSNTIPVRDFRGVLNVNYVGADSTIVVAPSRTVATDRIPR